MTVCDRQQVVVLTEEHPAQCGCPLQEMLIIPGLGSVFPTRKVPRGLKPRGFPDDPSPRFRGGIQARVSSSGVLTCRLCRVSRRGCVVSILRSPRLVSWGSSPGVPDPWYWLTFYAGSLPVPATAYVRRLDRTGNGPVIKDRLFLSTFVGAASSTALERAWHPPRFIGEDVDSPLWRSPSVIAAST